MGGVVSQSRDRALADRLLVLVRNCACGVAALLVCTEGWAPYPNRIRRAFREKVKGEGCKRPHLEVWPKLIIGRLMKHELCQAGRGGDSAGRSWKHGSSTEADQGCPGGLQAQHGRS